MGILDNTIAAASNLVGSTMQGSNGAGGYGASTSYQAPVSGNASQPFNPATSHRPTFDKPAALE